jgi:hypothetical protein
VEEIHAGRRRRGARRQRRAILSRDYINIHTY